MSPGDGLPFADAPSLQDAGDVVEGEPGVLEHAYEDEPSGRRDNHAGYPGFAGVGGLVAALGMAFGRNGDARLAVQLSGLGSGDAVVDVGCGPGLAARDPPA